MKFRTVSPARTTTCLCTRSVFTGTDFVHAHSLTLLVPPLCPQRLPLITHRGGHRRTLLRHLLDRHPLQCPRLRLFRLLVRTHCLPRHRACHRVVHPLHQLRHLRRPLPRSVLVLLRRLPPLRLLRTPLPLRPRLRRLRSRRVVPRSSRPRSVLLLPQPSQTSDARNRRRSCPTLPLSPRRARATSCSKSRKDQSY